MKFEKSSIRLISILGVSCLITALTPYTHGVNPENKKPADLEQNSSALKEIINPLSLTVEGKSLEVENIKGTDVINSQNEKLGRIDGFVFDSSNRTVTHIMVSTDNWLDGRYAVVPVKAVRHYPKESTTEVDPSTVVYWNDERVILNMNEDRFDELATLQKDSDLGKYLKENSTVIGMAFELGPKDVYDNDVSYDIELNKSLNLSEYRSQ